MDNNKVHESIDEATSDVMFGSLLGGVHCSLPASMCGHHVFW